MNDTFYRAIAEKSPAAAVVVFSDDYPFSPGETML